MESSRIEREHDNIGAFTRKRLFPSMDEFQVAHNLETSVDSVVFALLCARLVKQGYDPEDIVQIVVAMCKTTLEREGAAPPDNSSDADEVPVDSVVVPFRKKKN